MKKYLLGICIAAFVMASCQKEEEIGGSAVEDLAGEWFVQESGDGGLTYATDYFHFSTYNTAGNASDEMWLDDMVTFWAIKGRVPVNLSSLTFGSTDSLQNEYYDIRFVVMNGKVIKKGAKAPGSNTATDSIYFQVKLSDSDPVDSTYTFSGYKKTGFAEDEH